MKTTNTSRDAHRPRAKLSSTGRLVILGLLLIGAALLYIGSPGLPMAETASVAPISASPAASKRRMKPIEHVQPGDVVVSRDEHTGEISRKRVLDTFRRNSDHLRILEIRSQDGQSLQRMETTNEHPFWVRDVGFMAADKLRIGDRIDQSDGGAATVVSTTYEPHPEGVPVFNFEVADYHTYFVAANGSRAPPLLAHNKPCTPRETVADLTPGSRPHRNARWADYQAAAARGENAGLGVRGWLKKYRQALANNQSGNSFEALVRRELGSPLGRGSKPTAIAGYRPDLPAGTRYGVTDVKNRLDLSVNDQARAFFRNAVDERLPFNLIISPRTRSISEPLLDMVRNTRGGRVFQYDSATRTFSTIDIGRSGRWAR